jgi:hypothetical protein
VVITHTKTEKEKKTIKKKPSGVFQASPFVGQEYFGREHNLTEEKP